MSKQYRLAIFSLVQNENIWPTIWIQHNLKHTSADCIYLLDHNSEPEFRAHYEDLRNKYGINIFRVEHETTHHHAWLASTASKFQAFLLNSYNAVLYADIDEFVMPTPECYYKTITEFAEHYLIGSRNYIRCNGYEIVQILHIEQPIDFNKPLLQQRKHWYHCESYSKPLLANKQLDWADGFHSINNSKLDQINKQLLLLHLHKIDFDFAVQRHTTISARNWSNTDLLANKGFQNRITDRRKLANWWLQNVDKIDPNTGATELAKLTLIPQNIRELL